MMEAGLQHGKVSTFAGLPVILLTIHWTFVGRGTAPLSAQG